MLALICTIPCESRAEDEGRKEERSQRLVKRGRELRKIGDLQGSLHDLNEAVRIDPYNTDAYVQRGITRSKKMDFEQGTSRRALLKTHNGSLHRHLRI